MAAIDGNDCEATYSGNTHSKKHHVFEVTTPSNTPAEPIMPPQCACAGF